LAVTVKVKRRTQRRIIVVSYPQSANHSFNLQHINPAQNVNRKEFIGVGDEISKKLNMEKGRVEDFFENGIFEGRKKPKIKKDNQKSLVVLVPPYR